MDSRIHISLKDLLNLEPRGKNLNPGNLQKVYNPITGRNPSPRRGRGLDFMELRHYHSGDDVRNLDWRATLRTGKPHVRVYGEEKDRSVYILVDQRRRMFFGSQWKMKSVIAAEVAALRGWHTLSQGDRFGAMIFTDSALEELKPSRSKARLIQCFSRLAALNQTLNSTVDVPAHSISLSQVLQRLERRVSHDCLLIVISDFSDWDGLCQGAATRLARHNALAMVQISDPLEENPELAANLVISNGRYQLAIDGGDKALLARYRQRVAARQRQREEFLRRMDIPGMSLTTTTSVQDQLAREPLP